MPFWIVTSENFLLSHYGDLKYGFRGGVRKFLLPFTIRRFQRHFDRGIFEKIPLSLYGEMNGGL